MGGAEPRNTRGLRERFVEFSGLEAKEVVTVVFELDMAECTVGVEDVIPAIQLDCCGILLHSFLEMALLEEFVCLRLDLLGLGYLFRRWLRHTGGRLTLVGITHLETLPFSPGSQHPNPGWPTPEVLGLTARAWVE